jgi:broad specificity phosphatase PhoE
VSGSGAAPVVWVVRHGETAWSASGQHTSHTDLDLTADGEAQALSLRPMIASAGIETVLCSPMRRATRTAELAGLVPFTVTDDLKEWDYGDLEGLTTPQIQSELPGWSIWTGPWKGGETAQDVVVRADRLIATVLECGASKVALVGHGHFSRVLTARWVQTDVTVGRWLDLDTATVSELGWSRDSRVLHRWNVPAPTNG